MHANRTTNCEMMSGAALGSFANGCAYSYILKIYFNFIVRKNKRLFKYHWQIIEQKFANYPPERRSCNMGTTHQFWNDEWRL